MSAPFVWLMGVGAADSLTTVGTLFSLHRGGFEVIDGHILVTRTSGRKNENPYPQRRGR